MEAINWAALVGAIVSLIVGLYGGIPAFRRLKLDANTTNIESINKLSEQVNELIKDKIEMQDRLDKQEEKILQMRDELRKQTNASARMLRFIQKHTPMEVEIPNFFDTDPGRKVNK